MKRIALLLLVACLTALLVGGSTASARAATTVNVDDDFFAPSKLKIKKNATVKFEWVGESEHNVQKGSGPGKYFTSPDTDETGYVYKRQFKQTGKYVIICSLHNGMQMDLKVQKKKKRN